MHCHLLRKTLVLNILEQIIFMEIEKSVRDGPIFNLVLGIQYNLWFIHLIPSYVFMAICNSRLKAIQGHNENVV